MEFSIPLIIFALAVHTLLSFIFTLDLVNMIDLIDPEHRRVSKKQIWLLAVPLVNLFIGFAYCPKLSDSLRSQMNSVEGAVYSGRMRLMWYAYASLSVISAALIVVLLEGEVIFLFAGVSVIGYVVLLSLLWNDVVGYKNWLLNNNSSSSERTDKNLYLRSDDILDR